MLSKLLSTIMLLASISPVGASERFAIPGSSYFVNFTGSPDCAVHSVGTPAGAISRHACVYYDATLGGGYTFEYFSLPNSPEASKVQDVLRATAAGAAQATGSEITRERQMEVEGYPALEVLILTRSKGYLTRARYVLVERDLVTVSVDGGKTIHQSPDAVAFLESLDLSDTPARDAAR